MSEGVPPFIARGMTTASTTATTRNIAMAAMTVLRLFLTLCSPPCAYARTDSAELMPRSRLTFSLTLLSGRISDLCWASSFFTSFIRRPPIAVCF